MRIERIVVAVDGSENSLVAVEWAAGLARLLDAEVVAVHALGLLEPLGSEDPVPTFPHREEIRHAFETTWCAALDAAGVRTRRLLRDGPAVGVILSVAAEVDADLIVVGSRGLGGYPELLLGSTSTQIAQNADRPVIIVPASTGPPRDGETG
jgi:nucleotide-binding universal stress UspA family protein